MFWMIQNHFALLMISSFAIASPNLFANIFVNSFDMQLINGIGLLLFTSVCSGFLVQGSQLFFPNVLCLSSYCNYWKSLQILNPHYFWDLVKSFENAYVVVKDIPKSLIWFDLIWYCPTIYMEKKIVKI